MARPVLSAAHSSMKTTTRRTLLVALAALLLGTVGCDDVLIFDVAPDGRLLVAFDADGKAAAVGEGNRPRHLGLVDATTGEVARLTSQAAPLAWPRACGAGAVAVRARTTLVYIPGPGEEGAVRVLRAGGKRLFQPMPSPTGDKVAVLETTKLGVPGVLMVLDAHTGAVDRALEDVLPGFAWVGDDALLVPHALGPMDESGAPAPAEVILSKGGQAPTIACRATLTVATWIAPRRGSGEAAICVARAGETPTIGLARIAAGSKEATLSAGTAQLEFFPDVEQGGRVLYTRSTPNPKRPSLEGELRVAPLGDLAASTQVPTRGPATAPRWVDAGRVAYHTPEDHLVVQSLDGSGRLDLTDHLRAAYGESP